MCDKGHHWISKSISSQINSLIRTYLGAKPKVLGTKYARLLMTGYYVMGDANFVSVATSRNIEHQEQLTRRFSYENPDIRGFKTAFAIDQAKVGFSLRSDRPEKPALRPIPFGLSLNRTKGRT